MPVPDLAQSLTCPLATSFLPECKLPSPPSFLPSPLICTNFHSSRLVAPRWLVSNGQLVEAQRVVAALEPAPFNSEAVVMQTKVILDSIEGATKIKKSDVLTSGPTQHLRRTLIGVSCSLE